ncbi:TPA: hypothetical protein ACGU7P_004041 [Vibrio vulnificus]|nr:hypothetical protein [Vibrio vulnificus]HDY8011549.1 hypothetical protein [Vibrio vulnificus]
MQLAQRAVLESTKALKLHRQQQPARYERVIEQEGRWWRYYSDTPTTLYGEFLASCFEGEISGRLIYAEKLDESHWYMASFTSELAQEAIGTLAILSHTFGYALHHAEHLWITDNAFYHHIDKDARCHDIPIPSKERLSEFELAMTPKSKRLPITVGAGLVLCLSVLGGMSLMQPNDPSPTVAPLDSAKQRYEQSWSSKVAARDTLLSARNLLIQASMMPPSMRAKTLLLDAQTLTMPVSKDNLPRALEETWQANTPLAQYYQSDGPLAGRITLPLPSLARWQGYGARGYRTLLIDGLERLGARVTEQSQQVIEGATITTLLVEIGNANIGQVGIIADLLDTPLAAMSQLEMEMNESYQLSRLNFTLDVQGE